MLSTSICHTDLYTLSGQDAEGKFPVILGHEGLAMVEQVGEGVSGYKVGDLVIPLYIPECGECKMCGDERTNLCSVIRATQGQGLMPDGTSRFTLKATGQTVFHFMGCSTWSEYAVMAAISLCKVDRNDPRLCLMGCGVTTGWGAACQVAKVRPGDKCLVVGMGGVGLSVIQGLKHQQAAMIIAVDKDTNKHALAKQMGATHLLTDLSSHHVIEMTQGGVDWSFECVGLPHLMREALEAGHKGWGTCIIIGVAPAGQEISTRPFQLVTGRTWKGCAFGGIKSRSQLPELVSKAATGLIQLDPLITQQYRGVEGVLEAMEVIHKKSEVVIRPLITFK